MNVMENASLALLHVWSGVSTRRRSSNAVYVWWQWPFTYGDLVLDARHVEQRLDLLPQLVPRPGAQLQVLAQIALHHLQGDTLLLDLLVVLAGQVTTDPGLQPGHDLAETVVTELLHLTEHTGAEEHLNVAI